jgi:cell division protease FtsH
MKPVMTGFLKQTSFWIIVLIIVILVATQLSQGRTQTRELTSSDFVAQLQAGNVTGEVQIREVGENILNVRAKFKQPVEGASSISFNTLEFKDEWEALIDQQADVHVSPVSANSMLTSFLSTVLPLLLVVGLFWFLMFRQMQGGSNKAMSFGKSRARLVNHSDKVVTFNDVAGVDEAKEELQEIIEFLRAPKKFTRLGGKVPKGVLLVGPPGSGKTLMARAVAGEASVPFFSISGSDFVEMFVGVGASRVRDLFQQGQKHAPCIIFIDEIDAVGRQRGAGLGGGHDEREQTLNQLLVEMDGFNTSDGVILMAATNRPDVLDRALLRPGRFDRQIVVGNPDVKGREAILAIHTRINKVPVADDVEYTKLARGTAGFSGADLANMVNEAALLAARRAQDEVTMQDFDDAKDRVLMGPERRSMVISPKQKEITAYHEAGHAVICRLLPNADPVHKVTIIPRGPALGVTSMLPIEDRLNYSRSYCNATIRVLMGGRAAEDVVFKEFTNGASNDLRRATELAHAMVCEWGMSELGPISFGTNNEVFLGRDFMKERDFSDETASAIDREIHKILEDAYRETKDMITENKSVLVAVAEELCERETLDAEELDDLIRKAGGGHLLPPKEKKPVSPLAPKGIVVGGDIMPEAGISDAAPGDIVPGTA